MESYGETFAQWKTERQKLYPSLDNLTDDLHNFHMESSKYVCAGTGTKVAGTLVNVAGAIAGWKKTEVAGLLFQVAGGTAVTFTQLVQEHKDYMVLQDAKRLLDDHRGTHNDLKGKLGEINCTLRSLDCRQLYYTPDIVNRAVDVSETMMKALSFYQAIHGSKQKKTSDEKSSGDDNKMAAENSQPKKTAFESDGSKQKTFDEKSSGDDNKMAAENRQPEKTAPESGDGKEDNRAHKGDSDKAEISSNMDKAKTVLNAIAGIITRDVPLFFQSWETMNGRRVPETVQRLRHLRNDLEMCEDDLMIQLSSLFSSKEFQRARKTKLA